MREILFRGKTEKGEWCEGLPTRKKPFDTEINRIQLVDDYWENDFTALFLVKDVLPETVGQYTGLTDKNGKKIFEGDIVTGLFLHSMPVNGVTAFRDGSFGLLWDRAGAETFTPFTSMCNVEYEMIGNIHDNPELLMEKNTRFTINLVEAMEFDSEEIRKAKLECYRDCLRYYGKLKKKYTEGDDENI